LFAGGQCRLLEGGASDPAQVVASTRSGWIELAEDAPRWGADVVGAVAELTRGEEAPVLGARLLLGVAPGESFPELELRLATTRGTNALLERAGVEVVLFVTRGFADLLRIGTQDRPDLFALTVRKPEPLYADVVEVDERLDASGAVLRPLDVATLAPSVADLVGRGITSAAVVFLHSYRNPVHELELAAILRAAGIDRVSCSSQVAPLIQVVPRGETAVADAYLNPLLADYLEGVQAGLGAGARLWIMTSAGGLVGPRTFRAKDALLSGPAGGVVGAAARARDEGIDHLLSFDMGGTSTDVARYAGAYSYVFEHRVGEARIVAPALHVETVAAGGGSICEVVDGRLQVGPRSAGAVPGPACYGAGGPLTVTDVNLLLGRLDERRFEIPLERAASERAFEVVLRALGGGDRDHVLAGLLRIANERMAEAMRRVSVQQGYAPREHVLVAFGGAGGQHACALAELLGMDRVLVPVDASLLSAVGLGAAAVERFAHRQVLLPLEQAATNGTLERSISDLAAEALEGLRRDGADLAGGWSQRVLVRLRFAGQESTLDLDYVAGMDLRTSFEAQYQELFGTLPRRVVELESVRVVVALPSSGQRSVKGERSNARSSLGSRPLFAGGQWHQAPVIERDALAARVEPGLDPDREMATETMGPALIVERHSATVVEPEWSARVTPTGALLLVRKP
jgi:5-oxoprolinase (ATP-hydrolysing)